MASNKRNSAQIERDRREIADKYLQGWTQARIAEYLNNDDGRSYELSRQMISYDLQRLQEAWRESALMDVNEAKAQELAKIDRLEREYWDAWVKSQKDAVTKSTEKYMAGESKETAKKRVKEQERIAEQFGDSAYLRGVQWCIQKRCEILGLDAPKDAQAEEEYTDETSYFQLPASAIGPAYFETYRHIKAHDYTKFVEKGGRGALKSSFFSLVLIDQLINNPEEHALVLRQVANTLRDSVYSQIEWAINYLGLEDKFKCTTSPLQIEYLPTGQMIYFRGGDKPLKIKSIKPKFGHIGILWFEELDQFHGENSIRSIYQSAIRGGDNAVVFYSYNPPRSKNNWVYKWLEIPDEDRFVHHSTYLEAPRDWLGEAFIREAEHVKETNPDAYKHEYLGEAVALGGLVFDNVEFRAITDEEIEQFDHILHGLDWGYTIDPTNYTKAHFDAAKRALYIFSEYRGWKESNREIYDNVLGAGYDPKQLLIPDSSEPKSIADLRSYGAYVKGAEKGADSVRYSMKWLQSIKIIIDPKRCPYHAEEFRNYEYEQNKDGEFISAYPDKDNHAIDSTRYACNLYWRRAGV